MRKTILAIAAVLLAAPLFASPDLPDGKWWKRPRVADAIGLTADQSREIEAVFVRERGRLIDLKGELEKKQAELQDVMDDESADRRVVAQRIDALENARAELQKARALMFLDMKRVLRQEQWERLREMQMQARRMMEERRRRLRMDEERRGSRPPQEQRRRSPSRPTQPHE